MTGMQNGVRPRSWWYCRTPVGWGAVRGTNLGGFDVSSCERDSAVGGGPPGTGWVRVSPTLPRHVAAAARGWLRIGVVAAVTCGWAWTPCAGAVRPKDHESKPGTPYTRARPGQLPDSVVARVAGKRDVTLFQFRSAWAGRPGASPEGPTPAQAAEFLEVLVDRELLGEAASREPWVWTPEESTQAGALADRLAVSAALDSVLAETRRGFGPAAANLTAEEVGIAARDSVLSRLGVRVDRELLARLAPAWTSLPRPTADSSLAAQLRAISVLPEVAATDTPLVVGRSPLDDYRVQDLLAAWRRLHAAYRPRIDGPGQLEDLVRNGLFERALRREVKRRDLIRSPAVQAAVARLRESFAVEKLVRREAVPHGEVEIATLERWHAGRAEEWRVPMRLRAIRLEFDSRAQAGRTAALLRDASAAESLAAGARRAGIEYRVNLTAAADSALFAAGLEAGAGGVAGPVPTAQGWSVARIEAVLPGHTPPFAEVRGDVERRWRAEETERRLRELCHRLARRHTVLVNERATARLGEVLTAPALDRPVRGL